METEHGRGVPIEGDRSHLRPISPEEVRSFLVAYGITPDILPRCSILFCAELLSLHLRYGIKPWVITEEILAMEGIDRRPRGTKKAERFRHEPLRGLWKKHWFCARFIARNVLNVAENGGLDDVIWDALDPSHAPPGETHQDGVERLSTALARLSVELPIQMRRKARKLSGEWIVFAPHATGRHYLSISTHAETDEVIRDKLIRQCVPEYPWLGEILRITEAD